MLQLVDFVPHIFVCVSESEQLPGFFYLPSDITASQNIVHVQGDQAACPKPSVDIYVKVAF